MQSNLVLVILHLTILVSKEIMNKNIFAFFKKNCKHPFNCRLPSECTKKDVRVRKKET